MSSLNTNNDFWGALVGAILTVAIVKVVADIFSDSKTDIISDKGLKAINDPEKKRKIDEAFEASAQKQRETGIWENPVVDLN
jgi:hypothetical protein